MAQPSHLPATTPLPGILSPWDELAALCEALGALSAQVSQSLHQGAGAEVLVPLLRKEVALARSLQESIGRCGQQPPQSRAQRQGLSGKLGALLEAEQANQNLLKRRGIRLRGPRFPLSRLNCP